MKPFRAGRRGAYGPDRNSQRSLCCFSTHTKQLLKLREAVEQAVPSPASNWDEQKAALVRNKLAQLQGKWDATDTLDEENIDGASDDNILGNGVRRVGNAVEYDFSAMDDEDDEDSEPAPSGKRLPVEVKYFDRAAINVKAGDGGNGCCAFLREKYVAHGGPCGGNGGAGGSMWVIAEEGMNALSPFRNKVHWKAANGTSGKGKSMHGSNAQDTYIKVPPGTIVRRKDVSDDEDAPIAELLSHGDKALVAQGGRGGRGNAAFKSSKNNAPIIAEQGEAGDDMWLDLELKLMADVGIIGVPNSGKSTLLSVLSSARPKIADYAFTTLVPNLGVCELDFQTTVFADVPGLIEGAAAGEGLGHEFLRHVSRAQSLVHVIDGTSADPLYDYKAIRLELELFGNGLTDKPQIVAYNKVDVPDSGDYVEDMKELLEEECGVPRDAIIPISAATGEGVLDLVRAVRAMLAAMPIEAPSFSTDARNLQKKVRPSTDMARLDDYTIEAELAETRTWYVYGEALERFAQMTNWDYYEATLRFQRVLEACGLWKTLERKGVMEGDSVVIGEAEFSWSANRSEGALYQTWIDNLNARGKTGRGSQRWPHMSG